MSWGSLFGMGGTAGTLSAAGSSGGWWSDIDWGGVVNGIGGLFGGGGSSGGGGNSGGGTDWGGIFGQMLAGGVNGYAQAGLSKEMLEIKGKEDRKSTAFEAELVDYYKQADKARKRKSLDTYGQFDTTRSWAPNYTPSSAVQVPNKPTP